MSIEKDISIILEKINLLEGEADLRKQYLDSRRISEDAYNKLLSIDPTPQKKYLEWMIKKYIIMGSKTENLEKFQSIRNYYELFNKNLVPKEKRDINSFKNLEELDDLIRDLANVKTGSEVRRYIKGDDINPEDIVFENDKVTVVMPKNKEDSCKYGKNTKWCTAASSSSNYFDDYYIRQRGALYYVIVKDPEKVAQLDLRIKCRVSACPAITDANLYDPKEHLSKIAVLTKRSGSKSFFDRHDNQLTKEQISPIFRALGIPFGE